LPSSNSSGNGRIRRKDLELAERRRDVLDTAEKLFAAHGFDGVSVNRIAEEVGLSVGSIYNLFPGKEELISSVLINAMDEREDELSHVLQDTSLPPIEALRRFLQAMIEAFRSHQLLFRMLVESMAAPHAITGEGMKRLMQRREKRLAGLAEILRRGVEAEEFRVEVDPGRFAGALAGTMMGLLSYMVAKEGEIDAELSADLIIGFLLHGIGRRSINED
jgi:AcrR family transcriptional regulator